MDHLHLPESIFRCLKNRTFSKATLFALLSNEIHILCISSIHHSQALANESIYVILQFEHDPLETLANSDQFCPHCPQSDVCLAARQHPIAVTSCEYIMSPSSPTSPRHISIQIDPHLPMPSHRQSIASPPGTLSPSRAIGPSSLQVAPSMLRGNSSGRAWDEAQARERQRLQDIDSAKSMCKLSTPEWKDDEAYEAM